MILLALDPSSTCTGYAILRGLAAADLLEAGLLKPERTKARSWLRIAAMTRDVRELIEQHGVTHAVVEYPAAKVHRRAKGHAGLAVYGVAPGAMLNELGHRLGAERVLDVTPAGWMGDSPLKKPARAMVMAGLYPKSYGQAYAAGDDPGHDTSDAIALARWAWPRMKTETPGAAPETPPEVENAA